MVGANFVEVRSATGCPSAEAIAAQLHPMLPSGWLPGPTGDLASVEVVESRAEGVVGLRLHLLRPDGSVGGDRRLVLQGGCEERADAIATIIAAWETDFLSAAPLGPTVAQPANPTLTAFRSEPSAEPGAEPSAARLELALGASLGVAVVGGVAATAGLEATAGRPTSRWQFRLAGATETARQRKLDLGEVGWKHTTIAAGLVLRTLGARWHFSVDAGPVLGWATLAGHGYAQDKTQSVFEYGLAAGVRVQREMGRFAVWLDWRTNLWPKRQQAMLTGSTARENLSKFDMMASLGVSVLHLR
jgi:hypothetical protein